MSNTQATNAVPASRANSKPAKPTHAAKVRHGYGKGATYERIGTLFENDNGHFYLKLYGTQVVSKGVYLYKLEPKEVAAAEEVSLPGDGDAANDEAGE
jgi:hypothetical protein